MPRSCILGLSFCLCMVPVFAQAQSRGLFGGGGQSSGFGNQGFSSGGMNQSSGFNNGGSMFGNSGGGRFGGSSGLGGSGLGQSGGGLGGTGIQRGLDLGGYGLPVGENAFVGMGDRSGGFVGDRRIGSGAFGGSGDFGRGGFGGGRGGFGGRGGWSGRGGERGDWRGGWDDWGGGGDEQSKTIRPTIEIGFEVNGPVSTVTEPKFAARFDRITEREPGLADVTYEADGTGRVILRGTVPDDEARGLAAALFRLEPGVREVIDEMTVAGVESE